MFFKHNWLSKSQKKIHSNILILWASKMVWWQRIQLPMQETQDMGSVHGSGRSPEYEMVTHPIIHACKIPCAEEIGRVL